MRYATGSERCLLIYRLSAFQKDDSMIFIQRGRFIIDPNGVLRSMEITCDALGRNVIEVLRQLRALRLQQETGALMPCGWEPVKPELPGDDDASSFSGEVWKTWKTRNAF